MAKLQHQIFNKPSAPCWDFERGLGDHPDLEYAGGGNKNSYFGLVDDPERHEWPRGLLIKVTPKKVQIVKRAVGPSEYRRQIEDYVQMLWGSDREGSLPRSHDDQPSCDWYCGGLKRSYSKFSVVLDKLVSQLRMHVTSRSFKSFAVGLGLPFRKSDEASEIAHMAAAQLAVIKKRHIETGWPEPSLVEDFGVTLAALGHEPAGDAFVAWARDSQRKPFGQLLYDIEFKRAKGM